MKVLRKAAWVIIILETVLIAFLVASQTIFESSINLMEIMEKLGDNISFAIMMGIGGLTFFTIIAIVWIFKTCPKCGHFWDYDLASYNHRYEITKDTFGDGYTAREKCNYKTSNIRCPNCGNSK